MRSHAFTSRTSLVSACAAALLAAGCGYSIKTSTDYDREASFSNYQTFYLLNGHSSGSAVSDQLVSIDVAAALTARGWREVPDSEAQAAVIIHAATRDKHSFETFYHGWGEWQWHWGGFADSTRFVETYKVGTLVVDIFDARTKRAIWHGFAADAVSDDPTAAADETEQAVDRMFADFPPAAQGIAVQD
jgi:uncharacterized protein DUF4136